MGQRLLDKISEDGYDEVLIFDDDAYDYAFIGMSSDDRAVYDHDLMVKALVTFEGMTEEEAADYVSYNTLRSLPYMGDEAPIVLFRDYEWLDGHEIIESESRCDYCKGKDTEQCGICENYSEWHR